MRKAKVPLQSFSPYTGLIESAQLKQRKITTAERESWIRTKLEETTEQPSREAVLHNENDRKRRKLRGESLQEKLCLRLYNVREYKKSRVKTIQEGLKQKIEKFSYSKRKDYRNSREKKISKWGSRLRIWSEYLSAKRDVSSCRLMLDKIAHERGEWGKSRRINAERLNDWMRMGSRQGQGRDMLLQSGDCREDNWRSFKNIRIEKGI